jgi:uncharacterized protein (TIGR02118 family)
MAKLLILYRKPSDEAFFSKHYAEKHIPLAKSIPGLEKYEISSGAIASPQGEPPFHLVATLTFESLEALQDARASPEGVAAAADLVNFADGGADILIFDDQVI